MKQIKTKKTTKKATDPKKSAKKITENKEAMDSLSKCLAMSLLLSKDTYDNLSPDLFKKLFGDWKLREIRMLNRIYNEGLTNIKGKK